MSYPNKNGSRWQKQRDKLADDQQIKLDAAIAEANKRLDNQRKDKIVPNYTVM